MEITVGKSLDGKTVKEFLFSHLHLSRAMVTRLKQIDGGILLSGESVTVRKVMHEGDILFVALDDREEEVNPDIEPVKMPIDIVFEDEYIIVVNKAPGVPVHPSHDHHGDSLANGIAFLYKERGVPCAFRAVNRLDKDTSGLVIIAKSRMAANAFSKLIISHGIEKSYYAVLDGLPDKEEGEIRTFIRREQESIITRCNCLEGEGGDLAVSRYKVISSNGKASLVMAMPITGRTHQLRVHFAGIGCPIIGDSLYYKESEIISRQALHAFRLEFTHPLSHEKTILSADLPVDMERLIKEEGLQIG